MAKLWTPIPRTTPDVWAAKNRVYPPTSGKPGERDPTFTPYMIEWTRDISSGVTPLAILVCGAQMGKTDGMLDIIGERLDTRPAPIIYVGPSKEFNTDQFEPRIQELLQQAKSLREKQTRGKRSKKTLKWIAGVRLRLAHAGSSTALKSDPAAIALVDEYDEMLANVKGQGDPLGLVRARGFTYADFVTGVASTPSRGLVETEFDMASGMEFWKKAIPEDLESPIWRLFQSGTMHHWAWPCPECREYFIPRSKLLRYPEGASPARVGRETAMECPSCHHLIIDEREGEAKGRTKAWMNARGVFICRGQWLELETLESGERRAKVVGEPESDTNVISRWVSALCSPFVSWGERAEAIVEAENSGDPDARQTAINAGCGELYAPGGGDVPEWKEVLQLKLPHYARNTVPDAALVITAGVDVQRTRLPYVVRAWGARATSWLVDHGELHGRTNQPEVWGALADLLSQRFDGLPIKVAFIDSGFRPEKTEDMPFNTVYEFCRRHSRFVWPTKGHNVQAAPIRRSRIEVEGTGEQRKYGLELMHLDSDYWKSWVHERLRWPETQPGAFFLHNEADEAYARQIVSEARLKDPTGKPKWVRRSRENHYLDAEALAAAAGYLLNVQRIGVNASRRAQEHEEEEEAETAQAPAKSPPAATPVAPAAVAAATQTDIAQKFARMAAQMHMRK